MKKMFFTNGIQVRLFIAAVVLICTVAFALQFAGVHITEQFMQKRFSDRIFFLAKYLALNAEVGVLIKDRDGLRNLAANLLGEEDVGQILIFDNQNNKLVDISRKVHLPLSFVETAVVFKKPGDDNLPFTPSRTNPFKSNGKEKVEKTIGRVKLLYSTHGIDLLMTEIYRKFFFISILFAIFGGAVFYFISRPIVREIRGLSDGAYEVGKGNLGFRAAQGTLLETRKLSSAFNYMLDSIDTSRRELDVANIKILRHQTLAEVGKFSLMIAHEIKNPLGIIKSSFDILKKDFFIPENNILAYYVDDEIKHVNQLVEDFLSFARPSDSKFAEIDLNHMLKDICERLTIMYGDGARSIHTKTDIPEKPFFAEADESLLTRSISNLIKNAYEAVGVNGSVFVSVAEADEDEWCLEVKDTGEGISLENMDRVFEPFFTTKTKGTGLGLAFVRHVVAAHGGSVTASNSSEGGAVFSVSIPSEQGC